MRRPRLSTHDPRIFRLGVGFQGESPGPARPQERQIQTQREAPGIRPGAGQGKTGKEIGMAVEPGQLHGGCGPGFAHGGHAQGWPGRARVFPNHPRIDCERNEGHFSQKLDGLAGLPGQKFIQLKRRPAPLLFLLDDLVAQAGFLGPGAKNIGVSGRTGAVFQLQIAQEKFEPPERLFQGADGVPGKDGLPIGALHLGRHDEFYPGELGRGQIFAQAADLRPERALSRELEDLFDAQAEFRFRSLPVRVPGRGAPSTLAESRGSGRAPSCSDRPRAASTSIRATRTSGFAARAISTAFSTVRPSAGTPRHGQQQNAGQERACQGAHAGHEGPLCAYSTLL